MSGKVDERTHPTRYVTLRPTVLYTMVDAQCDKLATVVGCAKLTTLATIDVTWQLQHRSR